MAKENGLNRYLANIAVLNIKLHNLHWNVTGRDFKTIHKLTEHLYKEFQEQFDTVAETLKMQGELPMASMADYLETADIEEIESRDYTAVEVLELLDEDCGKIIDMALEIREDAEKRGDFLTVNLFEEYLAKFYKKSWMIRAMLSEEDALEYAEYVEDNLEDEDDSEEEEEKPSTSKRKKK